MGSDTPCDTREKYTKSNDYNTTNLTLYFLLWWTKRWKFKNMYQIHDPYAICMDFFKKYIFRSTRLVYITDVRFWENAVFLGNTFVGLSFHYFGLFKLSDVHPISLIWQEIFVIIIEHFKVNLVLLMQFFNECVW